MIRFFAMLAFCLTTLGAGVALACSCMQYPNAAAHAADADVIFVGRVVATEAQSPTQQATTFKVLETLKGESVRRRIIYHGGAEMTAAGCGIAYRFGDTALVIAHRGNGQLSTSSCTAPRWPVEAYRDAIAHGDH